MSIQKAIQLTTRLRSTGKQSQLLTAFGRAYDNTNSSWAAYTTFTAGSNVTSFKAKITVPEEPYADSNQTIFIFIGIQNNKNIIQPVLQWGKSAAGGGKYWSIAGWWAGGQSSDFKCIPAIKVDVGDTLSAFINISKTADGNASYVCGFEEQPGHLLSVSGMPVLTEFCVVLESYNIDNSYNYPQGHKTSIENIELLNAGNAIPATWQAGPNAGPLNEHPVVLSQGTISNIELNY